MCSHNLCLFYTIHSLMHCMCHYHYTLVIITCHLLKSEMYHTSWAESYHTDSRNYPVAFPCCTKRPRQDFKEAVEDTAI